MVDICERLDAAAKEWIAQGSDDPLEREAAAEIRRLRADVLEAQAALPQAARAAKAEGFRAGIEAAAKWHDRLAEGCWSERDAMRARWFERNASRIRALADAPKNAEG